MSGSTIWQRKLVLPMGVAIGLGLGGCSTAPVDQGVSASTASVGSGAYPNLGVPLIPAAAQITPQERAATADALRARRDRLAPGAAMPPASSAVQMRQIGSTHAQDAITRIETD